MELGVGGAHLPTNHRQVNERWLDDYRGWVYGIGYGFQLGMGVVTIVTSATTYLAFLAAFLSHSVLGGLIDRGDFRARAVAAGAAVRVACVIPRRCATCSGATKGGRRRPDGSPSAGQLGAVVAAFSAMMVAA